jgi:hypothetical protein
MRRISWKADFSRAGESLTKTGRRSNCSIPGLIQDQKLPVEGSMQTLATILFALLMILLLWVLPIMLGLRAAARTNRSAHWMWFGLHPVSGWIAAVVLMTLPALKSCPNCTEKVKFHARMCPYCGREYEALVND